MAKRKGKKVCWKYGKGKYCGTLIPSMKNGKKVDNCVKIGKKKKK